jgi:hypothetical protein
MGHHTPGGLLVANWQCRLVNSTDTVLRKTYTRRKGKKIKRKSKTEEEHKVIRNQSLTVCLFTYLLFKRTLSV